MTRNPEIGNVKLYPDRPLRDSDKFGFVLQFYCPLRDKRVRRRTGTRDRREARRIQKECTKRLINGEYLSSGGLVTDQQALTRQAVGGAVLHGVVTGTESASERGWDLCKEQYVAYKKTRVRDSSYADICSRLNIAERILNGRREDAGLLGAGGIAECCSLASLEYLQDRLYAGDECRYDWRSPATVNSTMGVIMAFVRYCERHDWIDRVPFLEKLDVDSPMKGRPITEAEFEAMLKATPDVVGETATESWRHVLKIIWSTAFRVGDVMSFSWSDKSEIHPLWPDGRREHPTIAIPSKQKNRKNQEVPMLPELESLLGSISNVDRDGWIANPLPIDSQNSFDSRPTAQQLANLKKTHSNIAIAVEYDVSETAVRKWLANPNMLLANSAVVTEFQRLTKERVGRVIGLIGNEADIVVQQRDDNLRKRLKYASAHDIRRGCAQRLINQGVSAETLKLILRHSDFATTEKYYGAVKSVQSASNEIRDLKNTEASHSQTGKFSNAEVEKLKALLSQL